MKNVAEAIALEQRRGNGVVRGGGIVEREHDEFLRIGSAATQRAIKAATKTNARFMAGEKEQHYEARLYQFPVASTQSSAGGAELFDHGFH